jgi:hypothetical protein
VQLRYAGLHEPFVPLALLHFPVEREHGKSSRFELGAYGTHFVARVAENHGGFRPMRQEERFDPAELLLLVNLEEGLLDRDFLGRSLDRNVDGGPLNSSTEVSNLGRNRCREQQRLPCFRCCAKDASEFVRESHVEHSVGFVEHEHLDGTKR